MMRVLGNRKRLCNGVTRRDLLQAGALAGGLGLADLLAVGSRAQAAPVLDPAFGRAKNCILLFLYGAHSQLETFDMKPHAPVEIRGTMQPIASSLPGLDVCEHLPQTAKIMDRVTVIRSVTHPYPLHGVAFATTGVSNIDVGMELNPRDERHYPYFGSCVEYFDRRDNGPAGHSLSNLALPFPFSSKRTDQPFRAGPYAAFLGAAFDPVWTEFVGHGTKNVYKARPGFSYDGPEPYVACNPDAHFRLAAVDPQPGLTLDRWDRRRSLKLQFEESRRELDETALGTNYSKFQEAALGLLGSTRVRDALDVRHEPDTLRDSYGRTLFGQSCLAARRLVEAGTRMVSVFWDEYGLAGDAWDTHYDHFPRMVDQLCPGFDKAFAGLISDLDARGLLDETLVVVLSEHGRTPQIQNIPGGGRDHWSQAYSVAMAGGGVARGRVIGATDSIAAQVKERPVSPKSLLATMYYALGINPHEEIELADGRRFPLLHEGAEVLKDALG
ncbi:MAG: DUF1501 domain-containing protein [Planctomyces sp.]|nr:DUF1501 domain-containing protein [Planctomyces sp.]